MSFPGKSAACVVILLRDMAYSRIYIDHVTVADRKLLERSYANSNCCRKLKAEMPIKRKNHQNKRLETTKMKKQTASIFPVFFLAVVMLSGCASNRYRCIDLINEKKYNEAENLAIESGIHHPDVMLPLGMHYLKIDFNKSERYLKYCRDLPEGNFWLGTLYLYYEKYAAAIDAFDAAYAGGMKSALAFSHYATAENLFANGKYAEAEKHFSKAQQLNPELKAACAPRLVVIKNASSASPERFCGKKYVQVQKEPMFAAVFAKAKAINTHTTAMLISESDYRKVMMQKRIDVGVNTHSIVHNMIWPLKEFSFNPHAQYLQRGTIEILKSQAEKIYGSPVKIREIPMQQIKVDDHCIAFRYKVFFDYTDPETKKDETAFYMYQETAMMAGKNYLVIMSVYSSDKVKELVACENDSKELWSFIRKNIQTIPSCDHLHKN